MPLIAPFLYAAEFGVGRWIRNGRPGSTTDLQTLQWHGIALDVLVGSVVVGGVLAVIGTALTYWTVSRGADDREITALVNAAAERYLPAESAPGSSHAARCAWTRWYLRILLDGRLPSSGDLARSGLWSRLHAALLATARDRSRSDSGPHPGRLPPQVWHAPRHRTPAASSATRANRRSRATPSSNSSISRSTHCRTATPSSCSMSCICFRGRRRTGCCMTLHRASRQEEC
jgi:hypothetical protein